MLKRALILWALFSVSPAHAGLFSDDDARKQIQTVQDRVEALDASQQEHNKQTTQSIQDLQGQLDAMSAENRSLRGQLEEQANTLQRIEKRSKDFYMDLDARLRRIEPGAASSDSNTGSSGITFVTGSEGFDPALENRALESGYTYLKAKNYPNASKAFKDFLARYPDSVQIPNAIYGLGNAYYGLENYKDALMVYQNFLKDYPNTPRAADVLLNTAGCQFGLKQTAQAKKTLKQVISKYPDSSAAIRAKQQLADH